jgi:hypothetical protein
MTTPPSHRDAQDDTPLPTNQEDREVCTATDTGSGYLSRRWSRKVAISGIVPARQSDASKVSG